MRKVIATVMIIVLALGSAGAFLFLDPGPVAAAESTFYITEDSYIEENDPDENFGVEGLCISDFYNGPDDRDRIRGVMRIDNRNSGGNVTEVLLKLYYFDAYWNDPSGRAVRVYRATRTIVEGQVTWNKYDSSHYWTTPGGDYSTANYASATMPGSYGWITWNITTMAKYAWDLGQDLYVVIRYRYEDKTADDMAQSWFCYAEGGWNEPKYTVTYSEAVQTPEVAHTVDEYGGTYADLEITPTLYAEPWGMVYAQAALNGTGNYTYESVGLNVTTNDAVIRSVTGLNYSTLYNVRAKLVYSNGTVYSNATNVTTTAWVTPSWTTDVDDLDVTTAQVYAGWTNNTNNKTVYARVAYRYIYDAEWSYTATESSALVNDEFAWPLSGLLRQYRTYYYKGVFTIDAIPYETDVYSFDTLAPPTIQGSATESDLSHMIIKADYQCNGADQVSVSARIQAREPTTGDYIYSDERLGLTGNGTEYFTFSDLTPLTKYAVEVFANFTGGVADDGFWVWTEAIETYPVLGNLTSAFVEPNILRLSMDVTLNDLAGSAPEILFWLCCYPFVPGDEYFATPKLTVYTDGTYYIDMIIGDEIDWDWSYNYYGQIDYGVGTNETDIGFLSTPDMPFLCGTLDPQIISGTSAILRGWVQAPELAIMAQNISIACYFQYWETGNYPVGMISTAQFWVSDNGVFTQRLDNLQFGHNYTYRAMVTGCPVWGNEVSFIAGGGTEAPVLPTVTSFWTWLTRSTGGHWFIMLIGIVICALIFYQKHRYVALATTIVILGTGIVIGWIDTWILVLLGIVVGLVIWRKLAAPRTGV